MTRSASTMCRVRDLVLLNLSVMALVACKGSDDKPPQVQPPVTGVASAAPHASLAVPEAGTPEPEPGAAGAPCLTRQDCSANMECEPDQRPGVPPGRGQCTEHRRYMIRGRPLVVDGAPRVASWSRSAPDTARAADSDDALAVATLDRALAASLGDALAVAALEEHASVAAFARTVCELMALGAPLSLLAETQSALADEIRHAEGALAWARALGHDVTAPGAFAEAAAPLRGVGGAADLAREVVRHGCVGETLAAVAALADAERAEAIPALHAYYTMTADDEARHAALAFSTAAWLGSVDEAAARAAREEAATCLAEADDAHRALLAPLFARVGLAPAAQDALDHAVDRTLPA